MVLSMIFETHAHYDREDYDADRDSLLAAFAKGGVTKVVNISATVDSVNKGLDICSQYPFVYMTVGIHPEDIDRLDEDTLDSLKSIANAHRYMQSADRQPCSVDNVRCVVGVGEIGLDYHYLNEAKNEADAAENKRKQIYWFKKQLEWTVAEHYPVVLHSREAKDDTINIVKAAYVTGTSSPNTIPYGILHCYSYDVNYALEFVKMGFMIGVGGIVTFKKAGALADVVDALPLENIVVETDAPYLSPVPFRGERNTSLNLKYIIEKIAQIKGISPQKVEDATYENAMRLYRI
jgi:TatD DNase family protein